MSAEILVRADSGTTRQLGSVPPGRRTTRRSRSSSLLPTIPPVKVSGNIKSDSVTIKHLWPCKLGLCGLKFVLFTGCHKIVLSLPPSLPYHLCLKPIQFISDSQSAGPYSTYSAAGIHQYQLTRSHNDLEQLGLFRKSVQYTVLYSVLYRRGFNHLLIGRGAKNLAEPRRGLVGPGPPLIRAWYCTL